MENTVEFSENINELAAALAIAQGEMKNAKKTADNPYYKSKYADLAECWDTCREILSKNKLSVVQMPGKMTNSKEIELTTMLLHASGQWMKSTMTVIAAKPDSQSIGSAITYGRRYALAAMVGIAQEDDDGNAASNAKTNDTDNKPWVIKKGDKTLIKSAENGKYYDVAELPLEVLEKQVNNQHYAEVKNEMMEIIKTKKAAK